MSMSQQGHGGASVVDREGMAAYGLSVHSIHIRHTSHICHTFKEDW